YWQSLASQYGSTNSPLPAGGEKLGTSIGDPLVSTAQQPLTQRAQTYQQQAQQSVLQAIALWKKATVLEPTAPDKKQLTTLLKQLKPLISISTAGGSTGP